MDFLNLFLSWIQKGNYRTATSTWDGQGTIKVRKLTFLYRSLHFKAILICVNNYGVLKMCDIYLFCFHKIQKSIWTRSSKVYILGWAGILWRATLEDFEPYWAKKSNRLPLHKQVFNPLIHFFSLFSRN